MFLATVYLDNAHFNVVSFEMCAAYAVLLKTNMQHKLGDQLTRNVAQMSMCSVGALRTDDNHICVQLQLQLQLQLLVSQWFSLSYTLPKSQVLRSCI